MFARGIHRCNFKHPLLTNCLGAEVQLKTQALDVGWIETKVHATCRPLTTTSHSKFIRDNLM